MAAVSANSLKQARRWTEDANCLDSGLLTPSVLLSFVELMLHGNGP